jgi:chemotaxis protein CheD
MICLLADPLKTVTLNPGDFYFGSGNTRISTLLGSCISITLWHPRHRIGGMCHYLLAQRSVSLTHGAPHPILDGRYADDAFALFLRHMAEAGTRPNEYQAKLFGGGNMFDSDGDSIEIGSRNIERARKLLSTSNITLVAEHVGGNGRRILHFDLRNGNAWLSFPEGSNAYIRNTYE